MSTTIYTALGTDDEIGVMYFVSLDGVGFQSFSRFPVTVDDLEAVRVGIEGDERGRPILFHRDLVENRFGGTVEEMTIG